MGILQAPSVLAAQVGIVGAVKYMVTTDNLAKITTAGYLNNIDIAVYPLLASDILGVTYSYSIPNGVGTFAFFTLSFSNGVITLVPMVTAGNVSLPVVNGDFAVFNGTTGQIKDSAQAPANAANPFVVTSPGTVVVNNLVKFSNVNGAVADVGAQLHAGTTAAFAGGGTTNSYATTNMTATSIVTAVIVASANSVAIAKAVPGTNTLAITFTADPGAGTTVSWISVTPAVA